MMLGRRELTMDCQNTTIQLMIFVHPIICASIICHKLATYIVIVYESRRSFVP